MDWQKINTHLIKYLGWCFFVNAVMFLPQIWALWQTKDSHNIALSMWIFFVVANAMMTTHCAIEGKHLVKTNHPVNGKHKYKMAIGSGLSTLFSIIMCIMILAYR